MNSRASSIGASLLLAAGPAVSGRGGGSTNGGPTVGPHA